VEALDLAGVRLAEVRLLWTAGRLVRVVEAVRQWPLARGTGAAAAPPRQAGMRRVSCRAHRGVMPSPVGCQRALVVNDDARFLEAMALALGDHGIDAATATTAESALSIILAGFAPSVILVDLRLGGTTQGEELVRNLRAYPETRSIPLVAVSASPERLQRVGESGLIDRTLAKPFTLDDLDAVLEETCGGAR
jgi:CheY-like chemotaxis protein